MYSYGKNIPSEERKIAKALEWNPTQEIQARTESSVKYSIMFLHAIKF